MYFQIALASEHVASYGWVPFNELGGQLTKRRRIAVKPKSADNYVGKHNNTKVDNEINIEKLIWTKEVILTKILQYDSRDFRCSRNISVA